MFWAVVFLVIGFDVVVVFSVVVVSGGIDGGGDSLPDNGDLLCGHVLGGVGVLLVGLGCSWWW